MDKSVNAGVHAQTGFGLQRNAAIFLLLENYEELKAREFFISTEHHEDFLFAFLSEDCISEIQAYQSKKKTSGDWKINNELGKIIGKILQTGENLLNDEHPKTDHYKHHLYFISNRNSVLQVSKKNQVDNENKPIHVNPSNDTQYFHELPSGIKKTIIEKLDCKKNISELPNFILKFIDFPDTPKQQESLLIGIISTKFKVADAKAALYVLNEIFDSVSKTYNQKGQAKLTDSSKKIESIDIQKAIVIITNEQKTFKLWRENSAALVNKMNLSMAVQKNAESSIQRAFEYMKDLSKIDHQRIQEHVKQNNILSFHNDLSSLINGYVFDVSKEYNLNISKEDIFWACLCSYVENYE